VEFSVVIPTFNRASILAETLRALASQSVCVPDLPRKLDYEVIVVDDGSTDSTRSVVEDQRRSFPVDLAYHFQQNRKQGAARNRGANSARGSFLLFLGDDIIPQTDFIARHWEARQTRGETREDSKVVVIGYTTWGEGLKVTPFMRYIGEHGWQFGFSLIKDPESVPFNFFYTSNLSIGRRLFLDSGGFDEEFQEYGWEDIELSLRLSNNGTRLVYQKFSECRGIQSSITCACVPLPGHVV
jgi:glycosyltransferase involved in cell wall biosynthesis